MALLADTSVEALPNAIHVIVDKIPASEGMSEGAKTLPSAFIGCGLRDQ